jgi:hypothetical protein
MKLTEFIDGLQARLISLAGVVHEDERLQAKHRLLVVLHYDLLKTLSLLIGNDDAYPLAVAMDIVAEIEQTSKEMAALKETRA